MNYFLKLILILIVFLNLQSPAIAELKWKETHKLQLYESVYKIQCQDSTDCIMLVAYKESGCRLYESKDGGFTWNLIHDEVPGWWGNIIFVTNMSWPSEDYLYITYQTFGDGMIRKSTDRGRSFSDSVYLPNRKDIMNCPYCDRVLHIYMLDSINGIAAAMNLEVYTTNDGWKTFTHHVDAPGIGITEVWMFSPTDFAYLSGGNNKGFFVRTKDGGKTWDMTYFYSVTHAYKMFFINKNLGFTVGSEGYDGPGDSSYDLIHKTTDGGKTWEKIYKQYNKSPFGLGNPQQRRAVAFHDSLNGVATGQFSKILRTTDGGDSWFQEYLPGHEENPKLNQSNTAFETTYIGSSPVLGGSQHQSVWRLMDVTSVPEDPPDKENCSVFPNPARTFVNFSFPAKAIPYELFIFNSQASLVKKLKTNSGFCDINIRTDDLPQGVYFYNVFNNSEIVQKGSFVVLK